MVSDFKVVAIKVNTFGLNPCCNGRWSLIDSLVVTDNGDLYVLILVVMEDGL